MDRFTRSSMIAALMAVGLTAASAAPPAPRGQMVPTAPGQNKLLCFDGTTRGEGYGGTCVPNSSGAKGSATLTAVRAGGWDYAGVYTNDSTMYGQKLSEVTTLSFRYSGSPAGAGGPVFSVPIDTNGDGTLDQYAFISALDCDDGAGLVDAIKNQNCTTYLGGAGGVTPYANWAAVVAAWPLAKIATDSFLFVVATEPGIWTVNQVKLGKPGK